MSTAQILRYVVDRSTSRLAFRIRLLGWKTGGEFTKFEGTVTCDPAHPGTMRAEMTVEAASIETRIADRDKHLRSPDYFETDRFPTMRFIGADATDLGGGRLRLSGELTIRDVSLPLALELEAIRAGRDDAGHNALQFIARGQLNRRDFGVGGRSLLDRGSFMVGHDVELDLRIVAIA